MAAAHMLASGIGRAMEPSSTSRSSGPPATFLLAFLLFAGAVGATGPETLDHRYFERNWRHQDGLPGNSVYAIAQSADRYIWIGTENGLARFDGLRFTAFGAEGPRSVFRSRLVMALLAGRDGTLWIGTERGLLYRKGGEIVRDGLAGEPLAEAAVSALAQDAGGDLWVGTRSGLLRRSAASGRVVQVELAATRVTDLLAGSAGEVWIGTEAHGAWRLRGGRLTRIGVAGRRQQTVTGLLRDPGGAVWIFTGKAARRFAESPAAPAPDTAPAFAAWGLAPALGLKNVIAAGAGRSSFWFATADRGPVRVAGGRTWLASADHPLANALVYKIFVADDRSVWFGAAGDGLHQLVERTSSTYTRHDGLTNDATASVFLDPDGTVWAGTLNGLNRMSREAGGGYSVHAELPGAAVFSVLRDSRGTLWAGTSHGLARRQGGHWELLPHWGGPATLVVGALREDEAGNVWVGTAGGLGVIADGPRRVIAWPGLAGKEITGLAEADDGALWIGTRGAGLLRLQGGRLVTLRSVRELPIVAGMRRGSAHDMWIGTFGNGLLHFRSGRWYRFSEGNGLSDDTVRQVLVDRRGDVWVCSGSGISRLARKAIFEMESGRATSLIPFNYGPEDGIAEGVCHGGSEPGAALGAGGELWFATNHGLVEVRPELVALPLAGRGPRLDAVGIDGREVAVRSASPLLISGGFRRLDLRFSFPALVAQRRTALRYRLVGFDREWILANGDRLARYTTLPAAHYRFEVALRDSWGGWLEPVQLTELVVQPLLYQRWSVIAVLALTLAAAVTCWLRWWSLRLRRRAARLETLVQQRTEELRQANLRLGILAVADPLTGLANRRKFEETLEKEVRRCSRGGKELSLIMIDVDHFKLYNDSLGHVRGDDCLRRVAAAMRNGISRPGDVLARYGGEEFAVLLPETSPHDAMRVGERIRHLVQVMAIPHPASPVAPFVTLTAGVAGVDPAFAYDLDSSHLIEEADVALYEAKDRGRNQVQLFSRHLAGSPAGERRLALAGAASG